MTLTEGDVPFSDEVGQRASRRSGSRSAADRRASAIRPASEDHVTIRRLQVYSRMPYMLSQRCDQSSGR